MNPESIESNQTSITNVRSRSFGLDVVRATAILLVLVGHASFTFLPVSHHIEQWVMPAFFGVELFFVLSGFLICGLLANDMQRGDFRLGNFWMRRWLRTLPNYYLFLILNMLLEHYLTGSWPQVWSYVFFLQCFAWPHPQFFGEAWSLTLEEIFYLVAPVATLAYLAQSRWRMPILTLFATCIALFTLARIGVVLATDPAWDAGVRKVVFIRLDAFIYGAAAMYWHRYCSPTQQQIRSLFVAGLIGCALSVILVFSFDRDHDFFSRTLLFSLVLASFAAMLPKAAQWRISGLPAMVQASIRAIARWSYSIYLCQLLVLRVLVLVIGWNGKSPLECLLQAIIFMGLSISIAAMVYRFFEKPILDLRDRLTRPAASVATVA